MSTRLRALGIRALLVLSSVAMPIVGSADAWAAGGNHFYAGYCTWLAAEEAHSAWDVWVPWFGDAGDWAAGARSSGWSVSTAPEVNSLLAMPRNVQGSGSAGHVGWVVGVDSDGTGVTVESMNWRGRGVITQHHIAVDGVVQFITPPTAEPTVIR